MKGIFGEKLWFPNYQNHLKNLKIKSMISIFVIIIIFVEIINNGVIVVQVMPPSQWFIKTLVIILRNISQLCYIPLLCCLLKVLWLTYLHSPYKYTIMRWAAYIVLRTVSVNCFYLFDKFLPFFGIIEEDSMIYAFFYVNIFTLCTTVDLITYLLYSRRFYLHLKNRELEAKLFMDRDKYIENKYLRIHFKVATILVVIALFIFNLMNILRSLYILTLCILLLFSLETLKIILMTIAEFNHTTIINHTTTIIWITTL